MDDPTRPAPGYPARPPPNGYPPPPIPQSNNYYYQNHNPYHAPPPPQYQPPRATFFRRFFAAMIAVFIILGTVLFIVWLVLRPRIPKFTLDSLQLSNFNLTSSQIYGAWNLNFTVVNPNDKLHLYYDEIEARLFYRSQLIAQNQLQPFDQGTKSSTSMSAKLVADSAYFDSKSAEKFNSDRSKGEVEFDVRVYAIIRFKSGGWRARRRFLRVYCDDLPLQIRANSRNGSLIGGSHRCDVGI